MREFLCILILAACTAIVAAAGSLETIAVAYACGLFAAGLATQCALQSDEPADRRQSQTLVAILSVLSLLVGSAVLLTLTGSTSLESISQMLRDSYQPDRQELVVGEGATLGGAAVVLVIAASAAPFHLFPVHGILDSAFDSTSAWRVSGVAVLLRALASVLVWRVAVVAMPGFEGFARVCCMALGAGSCLAGAVLACRSEALRRLAGSFWLAWGGVVLISLGAGIGQIVPGHDSDSWQILSGIEVALLSLIVSSVALVLLMTCEHWLALESRRISFEEDLTGLGSQHAVVAFAVCIAIFTLCGVPPMPGFWCVGLLVGTAFQPGMHAGQELSLVPDMAVLAATASVILSLVILAARAVRLCSLMFHHRPVRHISFSGKMPGLSLLLVISALLLWTGVFPGQLLAVIHSLPL